ncbi:MAG TPA: FecR family protein [Agriterribacter sp.]|nr:FecR family protein [Agriterribacter sp.]
MKERIRYLLGQYEKNRCSREELEELFDYINNVRNTDAALMRMVKKIYDDISKTHPSFIYVDESGRLVLSEPDDVHFLQEEEKKAIKKRRRLPIVVVFLTAVVMLSTSVWLSRKNSSVASTPQQDSPVALTKTFSKRAEHKFLLLPDSTEVWLNEASSLEFPDHFSGDKREVFLNGEAFFKVKHSEKMPFIIHTREINIKVLGTTFNVKSYAGDKSSETSLINGSIEVTLQSDPERKIILKPADKLVITNDVAEVSGPKKNRKTDEPLITIKKINYLPADSTVIETSWVDDRLIFRNDPFSEIALQMERKYGVPFRFDSPEVRQLRFTGNFKQESVEQMLNALKLASANANAFSYRKLRDTIVITK